MLNIYLKNGWTIDRVTGSHHIMKKGKKTIAIPVHAKELGKGMEQKLLKLGGIEK